MGSGCRPPHPPGDPRGRGDRGDLLGSPPLWKWCGLWCVPGRSAAATESEKAREGQREPREEIENKQRHQIPKIIEKTKENQLNNKRKRNGTLKIIWKAP